MDAAYLHELQRFAGKGKGRTICNSTFAKHTEQTLSGPDSEEEQLRDGKHRRWTSCIIGWKKVTTTN